MSSVPDEWPDEVRTAVRKALAEIRRGDRPSWGQPEKLAPRVRALLELAIVQEECGYSKEPAPHVAALGRVLDRLLETVKQGDDDGPDRDRSDYFAGCLLLRRPHLLSEEDQRRLEAEVRDDKKGLVDAPYEALRELIAPRWSVVYGPGQVQPDSWKQHEAPKLARRLCGRLEEMDIAARGSAEAHPGEPRPRKSSGRSRHGGTRPPTRWSAAKAYTELRPDDLELEFWWRESAQDYIEAIASQPDLTIYAGADGFSDLGEPYHREIVKALLMDCMHDRPELAEQIKRANAQRDLQLSPPIAEEKLLSDIADLFADASPSYVGSIVRGIYEIRGRSREDVRQRMASVVERLVNPGTTHSRHVEAFVATRIADLAHAFHTDGRPTTLFTAHYDDDICKELERAFSQAPIRLTASGAGTSGADQRIPPILCLHCDPATSRELVLSEFDLFREAYHAATAESEDLEAQERPQEDRSWAAVLAQQLADGSSLFVGSDIRAPGLIAALAEPQEVAKPRYALLRVPPDQTARDPVHDQAPDAASPLDAKARLERCTYLNAVAARYISLGIVPIFAEFPYQIAQILREISLVVELGEDYDRNRHSYSKRCDRWWATNSSALGFATNRRALKKRDDGQTRMHTRLRELGESLTKNYADEGETIVIEAWIRNPANSELFQWATSEAEVRWARLNTVPTASLRVTGDATQETFKEGSPQWAEIDAGQPGPWEYCTSLQLTLPDDAPWYQLPVGVVKVMSNRQDGGLAAIADSEKSAVVEDSMAELVELVPAEDKLKPKARSKPQAKSRRRDRSDRRPSRARARRPPMQAG